MRVAVLVVCAFTGLLAAPARAHTRLLEATPADGSTLRTAPRQLQLVFSEAVHVTALSIQAAGAAAPRKLAPLPRQPASKFAFDLPALAAGSYELRWRALSDDGHLASGSIRFTLRAP